MGFVTLWMTAALVLSGTVAAAQTGSTSKSSDLRAAPKQADKVLNNPDRTAYFGDLHLHTGYSFDAYMGGERSTPDQAYRFGRGDAVEMAGKTFKRNSPPLDFLAVTDHAEWMAVPGERETAATPQSMKDNLARFRKASGLDAHLKFGWFTNPPGITKYVADITRSAWQRQVAAANDYYQPGKYTTFIAYEWTSAPTSSNGFGNFHRNIIFEGSSAPAPYTSIDSRKPEDLWSYLEKSRRAGFDVLAIPHNSNLSQGLMFDWVGSDSRPIDETYAARRALNEPLMEIVQHKGQSETRPELSPNDEFANFEVVEALFSKDAKKDAHLLLKGGNFARTALGRGLKLMAQTEGANPYKFGFVGASDAHDGRSDGAESAVNFPVSFPSISGAGLTGVWAESNTRESIFAALRRKETFATSGTRLKLRFFGGWSFSPNLMQDRNWVRTAYGSGVPMGADLPAAGEQKGAPVFAVWAMKDPDGANLDRAQIIKVWLEGGEHRERIYDVVLSGGRKVNAASGKTAQVGNTVDLKTARYTNTIGAVELKTLWRDPDFNAAQAAVYYLRVIEIPTPRWTTIRAAQEGVPLPKGGPATMQERGWSSPIWYTPGQQE